MQRQSELTVVTKAKDLCSYVFEVTQRCPKQFRFTFVSRIQNLSLNVIENVYRANEVFLSNPGLREKLQKRREYQHTALTELKIMAFVSQMALEQKCILPQHFEQISKQTLDCQRLLGAWANSDKKKWESKLS
ncbi:MAG: four helix bundle protein [Oscillospiraceae bacterium]|nr:four helix bundle protein [Oscillospiraceae bacterium]